MLQVTTLEFSQGIHLNWWWVFWNTSLMPLPPIKVSNLNIFTTHALVIVHFNKVTVLHCYFLLANSPVQCVLSYPTGTAKWETDSHIPACPLVKALTYLLDITTPPSQSFLHKLSHMTKQEDDRQRLLALAKVIYSEIIIIIQNQNKKTSMLAVNIVHWFIKSGTFL